MQAEEDPRRMVRQILQRLESLGRAGIDRIPRPPDRPASSVRSKMIETNSNLQEVEPRTPQQTVAQPPRQEPQTARPLPPKPPVTPPPVAASLFDSEVKSTPALPAEVRPAALEVIAAEVAACTRCPILVANRTQTVFGEGNPNARLMFIGEGPGATEDQTGRPFVGRAGELLNDMITKGMGLKREEVYIANIIKCRPPENRDPANDEVRNCIGYLERQIEIIQPEYLCLLGRPASQALLNTALPLSRLRGRWNRYKTIPAIATYHPAYLLRNPADKRKAWEDLQMLMQAMGLKAPERRKSSEDESR
ncbi:uracil-DNA glycosylase [soil metagenome]